MEQLRVVGTTPEGDAIVVATPAGVEFELPVDAALRAAIRGDRPGLERAKAEGELRPREIQSLIRAGASVETVAEESGMSTEHILRYAAPVLDERGFVAEQAQGLPIDSQEGSPTLGEVVLARLAQRHVAAEDVTWDAWRAVEGWTVAATYPHKGKPTTASWLVDLPAREVHPADAHAHDLSDPDAPDAPVARRLRVVESPSPVFDFAAISPADLPSSPVEEPDDEPGDTSSLLEELTEQRGRRMQLDIDETAPSHIQPDEPTTAEVLPMRRTSRRSASHAIDDPDDLRSPGPRDENGAPVLFEPPSDYPLDRPDYSTLPGQLEGQTPAGHDREAEQSSDIASTPAEPEIAPTQPLPSDGAGPEAETPKPPSRSKRSKVPSWNEIVFGTTPQD